MKSSGKTIRRICFEIVAIVLATMVFVPVLLVLTNSLKSYERIMRAPFELPDVLHFENYMYVIDFIKYPRMVFNSVLNALVIVPVLVLISSMCGYKLSRNNTMKSKLIFGLFMFSLTVPFFSIMLPLFQLIGKIGLMDTRFGYAVVAIPLSVTMPIYLYHGFTKTIPISLEESAMIDGCTPLGAFFRIVFPLLSPITVTVAVLKFLDTWNDYLLPYLILRKSEIKTLTIAVFAFHQSADRGNVHYEILLAAFSLSLIPMLIFYFVMQKYIISGMVMGAVKS